jgi:hypothetical protein
MAVFENVVGAIQTKIAGLWGIQDYIQSSHTYQLTLFLISIACLLSAVTLIVLAISHVRLKSRLNKSLLAARHLPHLVAFQKRLNSREIHHSRS